MIGPDGVHGYGRKVFRLVDSDDSFPFKPEEAIVSANPHRPVWISKDRPYEAICQPVRSEISPETAVAIAEQAATLRSDPESAIVAGQQAPDTVFFELRSIIPIE